MKGFFDKSSQLYIKRQVLAVLVFALFALAAVPAMTAEQKSPKQQ